MVWWRNLKNVKYIAESLTQAVVMSAIKANNALLKKYII